EAELVKDFDARFHERQVGLGAEDDADDWAQLIGLLRSPLRACRRIFGPHAAHLRCRLLRCSLTHQRMRALRCSAPPSICTTWGPNLSTSTLIGLRCNIRAEKSPRESYLSGPGQR